MTGMGSDGREGAAWIKARGGCILTEAEETCVVYGMPRSVVEAGLSDEQRPAGSDGPGDHGAHMSAKSPARRRLGARAPEHPSRSSKAAGYVVVEAEDGLSALERYFLEKPDVVLLDLVMKGMYGLDVLTQAARARSGRPRHRGLRRHPDLVARAGPGGRRRGLHQQAYRARGRSSAMVDRRAERARLMELTRVQQDALIELLNIGFGRAAASLSQLTGHRVVLEVPEVSVHPISELSSALRVVVIQIRSRRVHQIFSGPVAGDALLILDHQAAGC